MFKKVEVNFNSVLFVGVLLDRILVSVVLLCLIRLFFGNISKKLNFLYLCLKFYCWLSELKFDVFVDLLAFDNLGKFVQVLSRSRFGVVYLFLSIFVCCRLCVIVSWSFG